MKVSGRFLNRRVVKRPQKAGTLLAAEGRGQEDASHGRLGADPQTAISSP